MSGDLLTLRMMVVSSHSSVRELWREAAALASVPIEFAAHESAEAIPSIKKGGFDIVLLGAAVASPDRDAVIKAARGAAAPSPLVALAAPLGTKRLEGVDIVVPESADKDDCRTFVERCVRRRLPKRILIVDDSKTMRSIVRKILSASRFALEVTEAEQGIEALKKLGDGYDFVLLDYNMPGFNGIETLSEIKRVSPKVAVVMMTSTEDEAVAGRAQASGAAAFLKKPFYPSDIDAVLERLCDNPSR